jgi:Transglutaminase-like superfamily
VAWEAELGEASAPPDRGAAVRERLRVGRRLPLRERERLATEIVRAYLLVRRTLREAPIESVLVTLRKSSSDASATTAASDTKGTLAEARRLGRAVSRLLRLLPGDTRCLVRSLVLIHMLTRRGVDVELVIGARSAPDFLAHAWVEYEGEPVLPPGDGSFGRLIEL